VIQASGQQHVLQRQLKSGTYLRPAQGKNYLYSCCCLVGAVVLWDSGGHILLDFWEHTYLPHDLLPVDLTDSLSMSIRLQEA